MQCISVSMRFYKDTLTLIFINCNILFSFQNVFLFLLYTFPRNNKKSK